MSEATPRAGLFASVAEAARTVVSILETRVELLVVEFQEEKLRVIELLIWCSAAVFMAAISLVMFTITVLFVCWDHEQARQIALVVITLLYSGLAVYSACRLNKMLKHGGLPFAESLDQLKKDKACLKG